MTGIVVTGIVMGVVATIALDLWAILLKRVAGLPLPNWGMVGRWLGHLPAGRVFNDDISARPVIPNERPLGWAFHYGVGVIYGVALAAIMGNVWLSAPTLFPAWVFSILMLGFGWFLLQPGLGAGFAASKTPNPWRNRFLGVVAHTVFGAGLWVGALI